MSRVRAAVDRQLVRRKRGQLSEPGLAINSNKKRGLVRVLVSWREDERNDSMGFGPGDLNK